MITSFIIRLIYLMRAILSTFDVEFDDLKRWMNQFANEVNLQEVLTN